MSAQISLQVLSSHGWTVVGDELVLITPEGKTIPSSFRVETVSPEEKEVTITGFGNADAGNPWELIALLLENPQHARGVITVVGKDPDDWARYTFTDGRVEVSRPVFLSGAVGDAPISARGQLWVVLFGDSPDRYGRRQPFGGDETIFPPDVLVVPAPDRDTAEELAAQKLASHLIAEGIADDDRGYPNDAWTLVAVYPLRFGILGESGEE